MEELTRIQALLQRLRSSEINKLSEQIDISRRSLYRIRAGETNITLATLTKLRTWAKGKRLPSDPPGT